MSPRTRWKGANLVDSVDYLAKIVHDQVAVSGTIPEVITIVDNRPLRRDENKRPVLEQMTVLLESSGKVYDWG